MASHELNRWADKLARALKPLLVDPAVADHSGQRLPLQDGSPEFPEISVTLGRRLGTGWFGGVYDLPRLTREVRRLLKIKGKQRLVAKVPHSLKLLSEMTSIPIASLANDREVGTYKLFTANVGRLERALGYPPSWKPGRLPVVPLLREVNTLRGTVLIKPRVDGATLSDLGLKYGSRFPPVMFERLREIYDFVQAVNAKVRVRVYKFGAIPVLEGLSVDVRPTNLVWIWKPQVLRAFGYRRPGFILYELDQVPQNFPQYLAGGTSFEEYVKEFRLYVKQESRGAMRVRGSRSARAPKR